MTTRFTVSQKRESSTINVRLSHGAKKQLISSSKFSVNYKHWSNPKQKTTRDIVIDTQEIDGIETPVTLNDRLTELKLHIQKSFTRDYSKKDIYIDKFWIKSVINDFHNNPDIKNTNHFDTYFENYIKKSSIDRYNPLLERFKEFQTLRITNPKLRKHKELQTKRLLIKDIDSDFSKDYANWMESKGFMLGYINQELTAFRSVLHSAKKKEKNVHLDDWIKLEDKTRPNPVVFTDEEIDLIYNYDLSDNKRLDNIKSIVIIGVYTGLRYSDIGKVRPSAIQDRILHLRTQKTGIKIAIPIHDRVAEILKKPFKVVSRGGFDNLIKEMAKLIKIKDVVEGRKRGVKSTQGFFPKHELVSSHTLRRSFATRYFGEIPTPTIMKITGHKTESSFYRYIGKESEDSANVFLSYWDKNKEDEKKN